MDSQVFAIVCTHSYGIHKALLFKYFSRPIISFSAILPRILNFHIRKDIRLGVRAAIGKGVLDSHLGSNSDVISKIVLSKSK